MAGISFSIKKAEPSKVVKGQGSNRDEEKKDFVLSLDGGEINSTIRKHEKKELVIPMIGKNKWRTAQPSQDVTSDSKDGVVVRSNEDLALDKEAAAAVLRDLAEARVAASREGEESELVVPLLLQNQPPVVEGKEKDDLADVELRPEQSTLQEYESVPIANFGEAMLKGMGWKKGTAIGLSNKGLIEPIEFIPRMGGLGLGATPRAPPPDPKRRIKKPGEEERKKRGPYVDKDGRVKYYKKIGEEIPDQPQQGFAVGNYCKVLRGPHKDLCGKIVSVDEDNARVVLEMAINKQMMSFSQHHLELVSKDEYLRRPDPSSRGDDPSNNGTEKQYGLVTKRDRSSHQDSPSSKRIKHESSERTRELSQSKPDDRNTTSSKTTSDTSRQFGKSNSHRHVDSSSSEGRKERDDNHRGQSSTSREGRKGRADDRDQSLSSRKRSWLYPHLRVRMIDQKYGKGKYYNTKVVILDVISLGECVCQTDSGKLLEGVTEPMLETVIPRSVGSKVMIVGGNKRGKIATIIEQDRHKGRAAVEVTLSREVVQVHFDEICEYTGQFDDDM